MGHRGFRGPMDRASLNLYTRMAGSAVLATLLLHGGIHLERDAFPTWASALVVTLAVAYTVGALWALSRMNVKRAAQWGTLSLLGGIPLLLSVAHLADRPVGGVYAGTYWALAVAGAATTALAALILKARGD